MLLLQSRRLLLTFLLLLLRHILQKFDCCYNFCSNCFSFIEFSFFVSSFVINNNNVPLHWYPRERIINNDKQSPSNPGTNGNKKKKAQLFFLPTQRQYLSRKNGKRKREQRSNTVSFLGGFFQSSSWTSSYSVSIEDDNNNSNNNKTTGTNTAFDIVQISHQDHHHHHHPQQYHDRIEQLVKKLLNNEQQQQQQQYQQSSANIINKSRTKEEEEILQRIDHEHINDYNIAIQSPLVIENYPIHFQRTTEVPSYQWIPDDDMESTSSSSSSSSTTTTMINSYSKIALQSMEPILSKSIITSIRNGAEQIWKYNNNKDSNVSASRFTYQYDGNSEAHLSDLYQYNNTMIKEVNRALQNKIYPLIRNAFVLDNNIQLFVYDSLMIRYNATQATLTKSMHKLINNNNNNNNNNMIQDIPYSVLGAGQPLHRDLGIISVNVMLNKADDEFIGGGTYFENQYSHKNNSFSQQHPLKPLDVGYCLAHLASQRHAGAVTTNGVRDILVFFISGINKVRNNQHDEDRSSNSSSSSCTNKDTGTKTTGKNQQYYYQTPNVLQNARLKQCRIHCEEKYYSMQNNDLQKNETNESLFLSIQHPNLQSILCRIRHYQLAIQTVCTDGEAYQYLGMTLMDLAKLTTSSSSSSLSGLEINGNSISTIEVLQTAIDCFHCAALLTPNDARIYNNLGITLERYQKLLREKQQQQQRNNDNGSSYNADTLYETIENAYQRGLALVKQQTLAGCNVEKDYDSICLNYGLCLSNQDRFDEAYPILERPAMKYFYDRQQQEEYATMNTRTNVHDDGRQHQEKEERIAKMATITKMGNNGTTNFRILQDAYGLWKFCKSQLQFVGE